MKRLSLLAAVAAVAAGTLASAVAVAEPTAADRATARALAFEGEAALESKSYAVAADRFARADALFHAPTLLIGLARAQVGLGKLVDAQETYQRIVNEGAPAGAPGAFAEAVASARKELQAVSPRIAWLTITVKGDPSPAVRLDDVRLPVAALGVRRAVDPGKHTVVAGGEGGRAREGTVTLGEGKTETIVLDLTTAPGDAQPLGRPSTQRMAGFALLGAGGAGIVVGAVAGALVLAQHHTLSAVCGGGVCPPDEKADLSAYHAKGWVSTIGLVGGAAIAGTGLVVLLTAPKKVPETAFSVTPYAGLGTLGVTGRFR